MNTLSYSITRENLLSGNYTVNSDTANSNNAAASSYRLLMSVIFDILNTKEEKPDEEDR